MAISKYLVLTAVADCGSLSAAASSLNYTQPAISHIIDSVEKEFGCLIFNRTPRGVTLTENGTRLMELFRNISTLESRILDTVDQFNGIVSGNLAIFAYNSVINGWFSNILSIMKERFPSLRFTITGVEPDNLESLLHENQNDLGIGTSTSLRTQIFLPLCDDPAVAVIPKDWPLAEKEYLEPDDLLKYPVIGQPGANAVELKTILGDRYPLLDCTYTLLYDPGILRMVEAGLGMCVTSLIVVEPSDNYVIRRFDKPYARTLGILIPRGKPVTNAMKHFISVVKELYQEEKYADA